jgi:hypothetical protein
MRRLPHRCEQLRAGGRRRRAAGYSLAPLSLPVALVALLLTDPTATAVASAAPAPPQGPTLKRRPLAVAAAVVPGLLLHGSGHFVGGDGGTARRLLAAEGVGLAAMVAGLGGLAATGAARRLVAPMVLLTNAGAGLLVASGLADLYGTLKPPGHTGAPLPFAPSLEAAGGALFVRNPVFRYRWLAATELDFRSGRWRLSPALFTAATAKTVRAELRAGYRLRGARPFVAGATAAPDGNFLDLTAGLVHHRESGDVTPFDTSTAELTIDGRHELFRFAPSLAGSFLDWGAGVALGASHYGGAVKTFEATDLLLARFAFGFWLGRGAAPRAEVRLTYDNRHDDFAGGLKITGLGSGPAGHFGADATWYPRQRWGLRALVQAGSAHVIGLQLLYRQLGESQ